MKLAPVPAKLISQFISWASRHAGNRKRIIEILFMIL